jgi:hypothetical protein
LPFDFWVRVEGIHWVGDWVGLCSNIFGYADVFTFANQKDCPTVMIKDIKIPGNQFTKSPNLF